MKSRIAAFGGTPHDVRQINYVQGFAFAQNELAILVVQVLQIVQQYFHLPIGMVLVQHLVHPAYGGQQFMTSYGFEQVINRAKLKGFYGILVISGDKDHLEVTLGAKSQQVKAAAFA